MVLRAIYKVHKTCRRHTLKWKTDSQYISDMGHPQVVVVLTALENNPYMWCLQWVPVLPVVWHLWYWHWVLFVVVKFAGIGWCLWWVYVLPGVQYMWYWWWVLFFSLQVPDPNKTVEYKKGYVMRKSCMEPGRRKSQLHYMLLFLVCVIWGSGGKCCSFLVFTSNQMSVMLFFFYFYK